MRRLAVLSVLLIVGGLLLLLPSSSLYNLITTGSASGSISSRFAAVTSTDNTSTNESLLGFALIGVGAVLEFLSLLTDVGPASQPFKAETPAPSPPQPVSPSGLQSVGSSPTKEATSN